ncbi:natural cytotoxicity triggering receptor 2-like isoform X3 [Tamandua tetradactyla]|uniref:natural cytotoxicity triggering receptor 2-like isoform X3 n=1 Tax=Tamandua tetradactyla TaxID=48850 RepID=UPI004053C99D
MAWETSHLPLILLLLVSGSWAWRPEAEKKRAVAGQAVSVSCPYAHRGGPYKFKTLCRKKLLQCPRLVTAFKPRTLIRASRYTVWDDPDSGFFNVTITKLKVRDSGSYWCATLNSSMRITKILKNIRLVVIPERRLGPVSTKDYEPRMPGPSRPGLVRDSRHSVPLEESAASGCCPHILQPEPMASSG